MPSRWTQDLFYPSNLKYWGWNWRSTCVALCTQLAILCVLWVVAVFVSTLHTRNASSLPCLLSVRIFCPDWYLSIWCKTHSVKLQLQNLWCEFSLLRAGCMREKHESRSVGLNRHLSPRKPLGCREVLAMEYFRGGPPEVLVPDHCPRSLTPVTWEVWNLTCWSEQRKMIYQLSESPRSWNQPVLPWEP